MTPSGFYSRLLAYDVTIKDCSLCDLHKPCKARRLCQTPQGTPVLDYDNVKQVYCQRNRLSSLSSADGICISGSGHILVFVEMKSWQNVIDNKFNPNSASQQNIKKKAQEYADAVERKMTDSIKTGEGITDSTGEFGSIPKSIVLVTDIDTSVNPLALIAAQLNFLAASASDKQSYCNNLMIQLLPEIPHIPVFYKSCRDFDKFINTI
jgi:hypothetical protein